MEINRKKLTFIGSMNYILQILSEKDSDEVQVDQYQPRRNKVWTGTMTKEELKPQVEETIERMNRYRQTTLHDMWSRIRYE